jgi:hypothetical protein
MEINGLKLPDAFIQDVQENKFKREIGCWKLKEEFDAFGNHLETEIGKVYTDIDEINRETENLSKHYVPDGFYGDPTESFSEEPGFIPDITDFSKIVCFAMSFDAADFCFDFRDDINEPSVIWWDDVYWRRIASNYKEFIALFDFTKI